MSIVNILIINGPNLNLLGKREPEVYGDSGFEPYLKQLSDRYPNIKIAYFQSNIEGELIDRIQQAEGQADGILLNAGGYSHTSVAIADAIKAISTPVIEVHISNVYKREEARHHSMIAAGCIGSITGFGMESYGLAVHFLTQHFSS